MTGRGVRDRFRRDYSSRSDQKNHHGRNNPPSRHLWVGNLSHSLTESMLTDLFLRFGELESVAFQPGRSYAFINYNNEEGAFDAIRELQGYVFAGNPIRIEFAKAEKSITSRDEDYLQRLDDKRFTARESPISQRDSRIRYSSPDQSYHEKSRMSDKNAEPSEVLWIGFPSLLKVDDTLLRKAFSPFGEIEKITTFPGRSYAFVRFRNVMAACRAKETLQGKLFDNPRVHICFAKSESGTSNRGRSSVNAPPSPQFRSYGCAGSDENYKPDRSFIGFSRDTRIRSPRFNPLLESRDSDVMTLRRKDNLRVGSDDVFEQRSFQDLGPELGVPKNIYEHHSSPPREKGARYHDVSSQQFPRQVPYDDDSWDLPEDALLFHGAKKLKISSFPPDNELPEYPFADSIQIKHAVNRIPGFPQHETVDKSFDSIPVGYKSIPDLTSLSQPFWDGFETWNSLYDSLQGGSISLPLSSLDRKRSTPESQQSSVSSGEWKWEGTIAKGGTPICRARCFPVGKVLDMMLPEFLDCTARTGLEMLAKHYYQAASAWVVFFVPHSDADIGFYNEFMNYLGEKQRAAVAKLDESTTLFLVPPSEFSEKVLKVPGKLSISGVVLRLEPSEPNFRSLPHVHEKKDANFITYHGDASQVKSTTPFSSFPSFPEIGKPGAGAGAPPPFSGPALPVGSLGDSNYENKYEYTPQLQNHALVDVTRGMMPQASNRTVDPVSQRYNAVMPGSIQETSLSNYTAGVSGVTSAGGNKLPQETIPSVSPSMPAAGLQSEQLALLASSFLGQQKQSGGISTGEDIRQLSTINQSDNLYRPPQNYVLPHNQGASELPSSQLGQVLQLQRLPTSNMPPAPQRELQTGAHGNQQLQSSGTQEEVDADPQKRLQATLQLAAALIQQIQQGKGT